ncbi:MAG: restriction endonuclease [Myxococcota bacterium]
MSFLVAARTVLTQAREPLHYRDITERALAAKLLSTSGSTPWETLNAQLAVHIQRKGDQSLFMRVRPGVFALATWGLQREPEPDLAARVSHLPTWRALRGFVTVADGRPREHLSALHGAIRELKGGDHDFTQPEQWLVALVQDPARTFGLDLWRASKEALNPRYVAHAASVASRYDLLEEDDDGALKLTEAGRGFLTSPDGPVERELDVAEGVARVLAVVAEHGPERSAALLVPFQEWSLKHTGMRSEATVRVALHARLANLADRGLVERNGQAWTITPAGLARLGREPDALVDDKADEDKDELLDLVREINEQQQRVRERIRQALYEMDPYAFEHLVKRLLEEMGYDGVEVTAASGDKGVDVVGRIKVGITDVTEVIQAKRQKGNVGRPVLDGLRGSLYRWSAQRGTIITTAAFSQGARAAAFDVGVAPIQLIDGDRLVSLLVDYGIGIKQQAVKLWRFDPEPFTSGPPTSDHGEDDDQE